MSDENEVNLDNYDAVEGVQHAKKTFSLADRLKKVSHRTARILIFTDEPAVDKVNSIKQEITDKEIRYAAITGTLKAGNEEEATRIDIQLAVLRQRLEAAEEKMYEGALSFHLKGTAKEFVKAAQRKGRKIYGDKSGSIKPDSIEEWMDFMLTEYMVLTVEKIVDSNGDEAEFDRDVLHSMAVGKDLPASQSMRLENAINTLVTIDGYEQQATQDAGF